MKCKNCGNEVTQGSKFCGKCGAKIEYEKKTADEGKDKKKHKIRYVAVGIGCLVAIGIAVVGVKTISKYTRENSADVKTAADYKEDELTEKKYYYADGNIARLTEEDSNGNIIKETSYDNFGNVNTVYQYEYIYDENGKKKECIRYDADGNKRCEHQYDGEGNLTKNTWYTEDEVLMSEYEYRTDRTLTKETSYYENGNPSIVKIYASDGNTEEKLYYYKSGITKCKEEFNENGMKRTWYTDAGDVESVRSYEYEYNADGEKTKCKTYGEDGVLEAIYEYGSDYSVHDMTRKISYDRDGQIESTTEYEYNSWGTIQKAQKYDKDGNLISETEYDSDGNVKDSGFGDC